MKNIVFYISDHGFGHASRNIPIIRYILEGKSNIKIHIKTGINQGLFIKDSIKDLKNSKNVIFEFKNMDIGLLLKKNSLDIDQEKLEKKAEEYINSWNDLKKRESVFLKENNIDLIISDIVPWVFECSESLKIKSLLISNFTWIDIYKEYLSENICNKYKGVYKKAKYVFLYDLYIKSMIEYLNNYEKVGLSCREFNLEKVEKIKEKYSKPIVFVSVGRSVDINKEVDVSDLNYNFICTEGINLKGDNVEYILKETDNTHDYIMASDYIITKAGWGTVSEALIGNKKIALLSREGVSEDRNTINILLERNLAIKVDSYRLNIKEIIKDLEKFIPSYEEFKIENSYREIGNRILELLN